VADLDAKNNAVNRLCALSQARGIRDGLLYLNDDSVVNRGALVKAYVQAAFGRTVNSSSRLKAWTSDKLSANAGVCSRLAVWPFRLWIGHSLLQVAVPYCGAWYDFAGPSLQCEREFCNAEGCAQWVWSFHIVSSYSTLRMGDSHWRVSFPSGEHVLSLECGDCQPFEQAAARRSR